MESLLLPIFAKWAAETNPVEFGQTLIFFAIAFWLVKKYLFKDLADHLQSVQNHLGELTDSIKNVETALINLEKNHDTRLTSLNQRVKRVEEKLGD